MKIAIITLFPEIMQSLHYGIPGKAIKNGLLEIECINPRDFTADKHQTVDDTPYGGGPGMVMKVEPIVSAIKAAKKQLGEKTKVIYLSPQGRTLKHQGVKALAGYKNIIFIAGRYEGIDQRLLTLVIDEQWSIGDYVLSGGEFAACVMIDAITRLLPGALGDDESAQQDSFVDGLLDYPHYTRPETVAGLTVPKVLLSGDHKAIEKWRLQQALVNTWRDRPDLLEQYELTDEQRNLLNDVIKGENHE